MKDQLTPYQKKLLEKFDPASPVYFHYYICDCEHDGDINGAQYEVEDYIKPLGGEVTDTYWDGQDCGDAWIECKVPFEAVEQVLKDGFFDSEPWQRTKK